MARDGRLITVNDTTVRGAKLRDTAPAVTALAGLGKARLATGGLALPPRVTKSGRGDDVLHRRGRQAALVRDRRPARGWPGTCSPTARTATVQRGRRRRVRRHAREPRRSPPRPGFARYFPNDPDTTPAVQITMPPSWYDQHNGGTRLLGPVRAHVRRPQRPGPGRRAPRRAGRAVQIPATGGTVDSPDWLYTRRRTSRARRPARSAAARGTPPPRRRAATNQFQVGDQRPRAHEPVPRVPGQAADRLRRGLGQLPAREHQRRRQRQRLRPGRDQRRPGPQQRELLHAAGRRAAAHADVPVHLVDGNGGDVAGIVYHEITHGLACRLVINASGGCALGPNAVADDERGLGRLLLDRPAGGGRAA